MANQLGSSASPYLLQHQDNPVDWREWSPAALAEAKARDVPILLSVGYAACHWCHVMAHESFENEEIAALMNRNFVNIKVDREERPDLDAIYQQALALLGEQGGWPLTMFLTPDGEPFWGGTYFPPEPRYGRPSFPQVLETMSRLWRDERFKLDSNRTQLRRALEHLSRPAGGDMLTMADVESAAQRLGEELDPIHGGLGGAPKFPQSPVLTFLWHQAVLHADETLQQRLLHTLHRMGQGGIYDHLGGGFARYSVDAYWLVPHFEKMLYDNGQLLGLLAEAYALTAEPLFRQRAAETVGWLEREMLTAGGFASSLDADSEGEEGKFYVWTAAEIDELLGPDARAFKLAYGVNKGGNWEGKTILNRLHATGLPSAEEEAVLASCRARLLEARRKRVPPGRDDKVLADWNGLAIQGLVAAAVCFDEPRWLELAQNVFGRVVTHLGDGEGLVHSWRDGRRLPLAFLDDYAQMSRAALALFEAAGETSYLDQARAWLERVEADFADRAGGTYFLAPAGDTGLILRPKNAHDGPTPAANGTLAQVLIVLHQLTGEGRYAERAEAILATFATEARRNPFAHATLLDARALVDALVQVVLVGTVETAGFEELRRAALTSPRPYRLALTVADGGALPAGHPAHGKSLVDGCAAAYVCTADACRPPVTSAPELERALAA